MKIKALVFSAFEDTVIEITVTEMTSLPDGDVYKWTGFKEDGTTVGFKNDIDHIIQLWGGALVKRKPKYVVLKGRFLHWVKTMWFYLTVRRGEAD